VSLDQRYRFARRLLRDAKRAINQSKESHAVVENHRLSQRALVWSRIRLEACLLRCFYSPPLYYTRARD
jgi:hypothetical protein